MKGLCLLLAIAVVCIAAVAASQFAQPRGYNRPSGDTFAVTLGRGLR